MGQYVRLTEDNFRLIESGIADGAMSYSHEHAGERWFRVTRGPLGGKADLHGFAADEQIDTDDIVCDESDEEAFDE